MSNLGNRIRRARAAAGLSLREVASRAAPLSATAVSRYEHGEDTPRPDTLRRLARSLDVPTGYFFEKISVEIECPRYRRSSRFGVKAQQAVEARIAVYLERYLEVEALFPRERFGLPGFGRDQRKHITEIEGAEVAADELRAAWELGKDPIENMAEALEDRGVKVLLIEAPQGFDGLACWANGDVPVVVVNRCKSWDRQRFDLAHELGELLLEPSADLNSEVAAHRFAGAFLAPADAVRRELGRRRATLKLDELLLLKMKYGLSMQAWIRRAYETGVISQATYRHLFRLLSARGYRKMEPGRERSPNQASRFELLVRQAAAEGLMTPAREAELLGRTVPSSLGRVGDAELHAASIAAERACGPPGDDGSWNEFSDYDPE